MEHRLDKSVIRKLREAASKGENATALLHLLIELVKLPSTEWGQYLASRYFRNAFGWGIGDGKAIGTSAFLDGIKWDEKQYNEYFEDLLKEWRLNPIGARNAILDKLQERNAGL
jgi:hypothetical protein